MEEQRGQDRTAQLRTMFRDNSHQVSSVGQYNDSLTAGPAAPAGPGLPGSPRAPWGPSAPRPP